MQNRQQELLFDLESDIEEVRKSALIWLAQVGDPEAIPGIRKLYADPLPPLRHFARRAVDEIEKRHGLGPATAPAPAAPTPAPADMVEILSALRGPYAEALPAAKSLARLPGPFDEKLVQSVRQRLEAATESDLIAALIGLVARGARADDVPRLLKYLSDPDPVVRGEAVMAMDAYHDTRARDHLVSMVADPDNRVRGNVLLVLGRHDPALVEAPLKEMAYSGEVWMKDSAIFVCRRLATETSIEILGRLHRELEGDDYLRPKVEKALQDLAASGNSNAARVIESLSAGSFERESNQREFARVLERLERELETGGRDKRVDRVTVETWPSFETYVQGETFEERLSAVEAGHRFPKEQVLPIFRRMIETETHPFVVSKLAKELGRIGDPEDAERIARFLKHPDQRVRANAVEGMGFLGGEAGAEWVRPCLEDPSPRVRANAAKVVYRVDRAKAFVVLKDMILSKQSGDVESATHALGEVHADDVFELMELALARDEQEVKINVLKALQLLSRQSRMASRVYEHYREEGERVLLGGADLGFLLKMVRDPDVDVRLRALISLSKSPDSRARKALEQATRDTEPAVREQAQRSLTLYDLAQDLSMKLYRLGATVYRVLREGNHEISILEEALEKIQTATREIDQGGTLPENLKKRTEGLQELANEARPMIEGGVFAAHPDNAKLIELVQEIQHAEKLIEVRNEEMDHEEVTRQAARASGKTKAEAESTGWREMVQVALTQLAQSRGAMVILVSGMGLAFLALMAFLFTGGGMTAGWQHHTETAVVHVRGVGDHALAITDTGHIMVLDGEDGKPRWEWKSRPVPRPFPPTLDLGQVVVSGPEGEIVSIGRGHGREVWNARLTGLAHAPIRQGPYFWAFTTGADSSLHWLEPASGKVKGRRAAGSADVMGITAFREDIAVVRPGEVRVTDLSLDKELWTWTSASPIEAKPLPFTHAERLIVRTASELVALAPGGKKSWGVEIAEGVRVLASLDPGGPILVLEGTSLKVIDHEGQVTQEITLEEEVKAAVAGREVLYYSGATALWRQALTGKKSSKLPQPAAAVKDLYLVDGILLVGTAKGVLTLSGS